MTAPTLLDLIYIKRNFLSRDQCNVIINEFETSACGGEREHCYQAFTNIDTYSTFKTKDSQIIKAFNDFLIKIKNIFL